MQKTLQGKSSKIDSVEKLQFVIVGHLATLCIMIYNMQKLLAELR